MSTYKHCYFTFLIGAVGYCLLEILWRGYTHPSMGIAGGLSLIGICYINKLNKSRIFRAFLASLLITAIEFVFGFVLNILLRLQIWDYRALPFDFMGQICIPFSAIWFILSYVVLFTLDYKKKES